MNINLRWTIIEDSTPESIIHETYYIQKNIFSSIIIDCSKEIHISLIKYFTNLIVNIVGSGENVLFTMANLEGENEIVNRCVLLIRKDLVPKLMAEKETLIKKGFVFY